MRKPRPANVVMVVCPDCLPVGSPHSEDLKVVRIEKEGCEEEGRRIRLCSRCREWHEEVFWKFKEDVTDRCKYDLRGYGFVDRSGFVDYHALEEARDLTFFTFLMKSIQGRYWPLPEDKVKGYERFRAPLLVMAKYAVLGLVRKRGRDPKSLSSISSSQSDEDLQFEHVFDDPKNELVGGWITLPPDLELELNDTLRRLDDALNALPEDQRGIVIASEVNGETYEVIAQKSGVKKEHVHYLKSKAMRTLRTKLGGDENKTK